VLPAVFPLRALHERCRSASSWSKQVHRLHRKCLDIATCGTGYGCVRVRSVISCLCAAQRQAIAAACGRPRCRGGCGPKREAGAARDWQARPHAHGRHGARKTALSSRSGSTAPVGGTARPSWPTKVAEKALSGTRATPWAGVCGLNGPPGYAWDCSRRALGNFAVPGRQKSRGRSSLRLVGVL